MQKMGKSSLILLAQVYSIGLKKGLAGFRTVHCIQKESNSRVILFGRGGCLSLELYSC
jgi:hypothetical protein